MKVMVKNCFKDQLPNSISVNYEQWNLNMNQFLKIPWNINNLNVGFCAQNSVPKCSKEWSMYPMSTVPSSKSLLLKLKEKKTRKTFHSLVLPPALQKKATNLNPLSHLFEIQIQTRTNYSLKHKKVD
jgi:hypothetical protein